MSRRPKCLAKQSETQKSMRKKRPIWLISQKQIDLDQSKSPASKTSRMLCLREQLAQAPIDNHQNEKINMQRKSNQNK